MKKELALVTSLLFSQPLWAGYWVTASDGYIPIDAYQVGAGPLGSPLYSCKGMYNGVMYRGLINSGYGGCSLNVNGNMITVVRYMVWSDNTVFGKSEPTSFVGPFAEGASTITSLPYVGRRYDNDNWKGYHWRERGWGHHHNHPYYRYRYH